VGDGQIDILLLKLEIAEFPIAPGSLPPWPGSTTIAFTEYVEEAAGFV